MKFFKHCRFCKGQGCLACAKEKERFDREVRDRENVMRIEGEGSRDHGRLRTITIASSPESIDALKAMIAGDCLLSNGQGRPLRVELHESVDITPDPVTRRHWDPLPAKDQEVEVGDGWGTYRTTYKRVKSGWNAGLHFDSAKGQRAVSLYVSHPGALQDRPEVERACQRLLGAGFEPLRSPRGADGQYWEKWYLPFLGKFSAVEELADEDLTVANVMQWLMSIPVGTVDVVSQRIGLMVE